MYLQSPRGIVRLIVEWFLSWEHNPWIGWKRIHNVDRRQNGGWSIWTCTILSSSWVRQLLYYVHSDWSNIKHTQCIVHITTLPWLIWISGNRRNHKAIHWKGKNRILAVYHRSHCCHKSWPNADMKQKEWTTIKVKLIWHPTTKTQYFEIWTQNEIKMPTSKPQVSKIFLYNRQATRFHSAINHLPWETL